MSKKDFYYSRIAEYDADNSEFSVKTINGDVYTKTENTELTLYSNGISINNKRITISIAFEDITEIKNKINN